MASIAIVNWPLNDVGGINSWIKNFTLGCKTLGHEVDLFHCTPQTRYECSKDLELHRRRYSVLRGEHLSYREGAEPVLERLRDYDAVVYGHTSPHPTSAVLSTPGHRNWMDIYRGVHKLGIPSAVIFHDANWTMTNLWYLEVRGLVKVAVAAQAIFSESMGQWIGKSDTEGYWTYFPMPEVSPPPIIEADNYGILFTQWLQWKRHKDFIPLLSELEVPMRMYGGGITYHSLNKEWENVRDLTDGTGEGIHTYHGFVPYEEVMSALSRARFAIDLSYRGYTNMSHWEPLWRGVPNLVERRVLENKWCQLPKKFCTPFDLDGPLGTIRATTGGRSVEAQEWMADHCAPQVVAKEILEWMM